MACTGAWQAPVTVMFAITIVFSINGRDRRPPAPTNLAIAAIPTKSASAAALVHAGYCVHRGNRMMDTNGRLPGAPTEIARRMRVCKNASSCPALYAQPSSI